MSLRELRVLIEHLPPESATLTAMRVATPEDELDEQAKAADPETGAWSRADMLLAQVVDAVNQLAYLYTLANSDKKKPSPPKPVPRPGVRAATRPRLSKAGAELLWRLRGGK